MKNIIFFGLLLFTASLCFGCDDEVKTTYAVVEFKGKPLDGSNEYLLIIKLEDRGSCYHEKNEGIYYRVEKGQRIFVSYKWDNENRVVKEIKYFLEEPSTKPTQPSGG